jgi:hypothetical protein
MKHTAPILTLALLALLAATSSSSAQTVSTTVSPAPQSHGPSLWGILPWHGIGIGGRYMIPLSVKPLLTNTNVRDGFAAEVGADLLHWSYGIGVANDYSWTEALPVAGIMWNVWLNEQLALYPKLDLGYAFGWFSGWNETYGSRPTYGGFFWDIALGGMYKLGNGLTLRGEIGYAGLKLGAGWLF